MFTLIRISLYNDRSSYWITDKDFFAFRDFCTGKAAQTLSAKRTATRFIKPKQHFAHEYMAGDIKPHFFKAKAANKIGADT